MNLTRLDRAKFWFQFEILKSLPNADSKYYEELQTIVSSGYTNQYYRLFECVDRSDFPEEECEFVADVLEMYRALDDGIDPKVAPKVSGEDGLYKFRGFDGNEEAAHLAYARFLIETQGKWIESKLADFNSHFPTIPTYKAMLRVWKSLPQHRQQNPTGEDAKAMLEAGRAA